MHSELYPTLNETNVFINCFSPGSIVYGKKDTKENLFLNKQKITSMRLIMLWGHIKRKLNYPDLL